MHHFAADHGHEHAGLRQPLEGAGEVVAVDDDQVGEFAGFEAAFVGFFVVEVGVVDGVEAEGLLAGEGASATENALSTVRIFAFRMIVSATPSAGPSPTTAKSTQHTATIAARRKA